MSKAIENLEAQFSAATQTEDGARTKGAVGGEESWLRMADSKSEGFLQ